MTITTPSLTSARAAADDALNIAWEATDADGDPMIFLVNYSYDGGNTWMPLGGITNDTDRKRHV